MRVLFVSEGLDKGSIVAQPWRNMYEIARNLTQERHEVAIATDSPRTDMRREIEICGVPVYILPKTRLPPLMWRRMSALEVGRLVRELSPDIIYWDGGALVGNYIRKVKGINKPVVVHISTNLYTVKDLRLPEYRSIDRGFLVYAITMSTPLGRLLVRLLNRETIKMITVPNRSIKENLVKVGISATKIQVLPIPFQKERAFLSVKASEDFTRTREEIGLRLDDFVVAYFGPPQIYRGIDTLLYAVRRLKQKLPQLRLVMLLRSDEGSEDAQEKLLRKMASDLQLNEEVKFVSGILRREELLEAIKNFDVIALPFKFLMNEPPITVVEAMALGKPLITTRVSGLPELVGEHAFLVEPRNGSDLANAIYFIARNFEQATERGRRAREYVLKLPEWNDYANYTAKLFESLISHY